MQDDDGGWRTIDGHYEVSRTGSVRRTRDGRIMGQWLSAQGYSLVRLARPRRTIRVHRLVAKAFIPNPDSLPFVNHLDCNRSHNDASNLEWCTQKENLDHAERLGRMRRNYWKGRRSPRAALSEEIAEEIRATRRATGLSLEKLARQFGASKRTVGRIISGETYV
jgi:AraC-like DNA-binding protein